MVEFTGFDITGTIYEGANTHVFRAVKADNNQAVILKTTSSAHPSPHEVARYQHEYNILN